jgi:4-hydroxybenzoate polyprenyltransferase
VTAANLLAVTFAFMVNDIEDAPDDAQDRIRGAHNAVACGEISPRAGWVVSGLVGSLALVLFASINRETFAAGGLTLGLGLLYSWRPVRLKAFPAVDVLSHVLMLSSLLFLAGYFVYDAGPGRAWWAAAGVGLISAYGQLYNQLRDYDMDRSANLHNTASILGRQVTQRLMYVGLGAAGLCLGITVIMGLWPLWLMIVPLLMSPLLIFARFCVDMRGTQAIDLSGHLQWGAMIIATTTILIWSLKIMAL